MSSDFKSARFWARALLEGAVYPGARAIDATAGNGHDALWLSQRVGETGCVHVFDVQEKALANTRALLEAHKLADRAQLILSGHEAMETYVAEPVDAIVFNLGWLPGGMRDVTTRVETTLCAAAAGTRLLKEAGLMTICIYPGHDEGARELAALTHWASALDPAQFDVMLHCYLNQKNDPPQMIAVRRRG